MSRLILLIILGIVAAMYFPDSRAFILDKARPALTPVLRWQTKGEMEDVLRGLKTYEQENYGRLPGRREWQGWLDRNFSGGAGVDSWESRYHFQVQRDSFYIVSSGPDRVYQTEDDIRVGSAKARPGR